MEKNEFKKMFGQIAGENGFERAFEGWFREFPEVIQVLELQKSNYGDYYYLNIKFYIQGMFGNQYCKSKELVKIHGGNVDERPPDSYSYLLALDNGLEDNIRREGIKELFTLYVVPLCDNMSTKAGIIELNKKGDLFILPAVKKQLGIPI